MIPVLTAARRVSVEWLWSQHNEHRIPLPRLVLLGLLRLSAGDYRAAMIFNVVALASLALGMVLVARRGSGTWRETDAFFPLALLDLGHHANLLWGWQVQFVLSTVLSGLLPPPHRVRAVMARTAEVGPGRSHARPAAPLRRQRRGPGPRIVTLAPRVDLWPGSSMGDPVAVEPAS